MSLITLGLKEAATKLKNKEISAVELTKATLDRIDERNGTINAYNVVCHDVAMKMAEESDKRIASGEAGLIEGVPIGMKDLFCTKGVSTTASSKILSNFVPPYESTVSGKLWNAGGVMMGKTNLDEFAMGSSNETSFTGKVLNPWDTTLTPGGSSGGSSAAVADFMCAGATGTDTGGSIRQPASFTGIVGIKPTYGRCSRYGIVAFASSLDQAGAMTRNVEDAALMLRAMSGHDPLDSTSASNPVEAWDETLNDFDPKGLRIGLPKEYFIEGLDPNIRKAVDDAVKRFTDAGAEVKEISLPHTKYAVPTYYIIAPAEAASNLSRYDGMRFGYRAEGENLAQTYSNSRSEGFGWEVKRRIMVGNYTLSSGYYDAYYIKAQKVRALIAQDFANAYKEVDVIFTPTAPSTAFKLGDKISDPIQMYLNDVFTVATSLAGLPGISVPAGLVEGLPVGLQIIGQAFGEEKLLQVAQAHEKMCGFQMRAPNATATAA
ncbi:MAG: Asp-tRNA(Asn)/Glu-tRNA(Gln) amidotransferase GatCAB subunit A [Magnetococcales bacterium]|nr:Asp-tRNA(Asn)/Glu-tRNA(Gln) amidotransferase GatCAB subunit A [Magnetococcales bacterium]|tara:strand:- start:98320 stop:99789 length:1470 start_codon:yes stop_codon:yes gene_type:complete